MSQKTKWTPGPWRWHGFYLMQDCPAKHDAGKETNPYNTPAGAPIADDGSAGGEYGSTIDISGPNARLIAAAPELYEALDQMTAWAGGIDADKLPPPWPEMVKQALAALAKARGENPNA